MPEEKGRPRRHTGAENVERDRQLRREGKDGPGVGRGEDPPIASKSGPGGGDWAPGDTRVSGPADYGDPWKPRGARWKRLKRVVSNWVGGGG